MSAQHSDRPSWMLPALGKDRSPVPCLCCGPKPVTVGVKTPLVVGFGAVTVTRDGETVWSGDDEDKTLMEFETSAALDSDHDWRVCFYGPLSEVEYQRQALGTWVLVRTGDGFA